jgi:hypothetical protein
LLAAPPPYAFAAEIRGREGSPQKGTKDAKEKQLQTFTSIQSSATLCRLVVFFLRLLRLFAAKESGIWRLKSAAGFALAVTDSSRVFSQAKTTQFNPVPTEPPAHPRDRFFGGKRDTFRGKLRISLAEYSSR